MNRKKVVVAKHTVFVKGTDEIYGTGSAIESFLRNKDVDCFFIKHPIVGGLPSVIEGSIGGVNFRERLSLSNSSFLPLKSWQELKITFRVLHKIKGQIDLFIGIDPLNAFFGLLAKKRGKVKKVFFYTADYAVERFGNPLVNWLYHWFDRYAIGKADQVWNVSTRITELRRQQGVREDRIFFVPNSPKFHKIKRLDFKEINKHDLVLVSNLTSAIDFPLIIKAVKKLSKKYPAIKLLIIGEGEYKKDLEALTKKLAMEKNVLFLGRKEHPEVLKILSHSAVGIALYTRDCPWTEFGDSMKVREYLACGLPVIMTDVPSTADDIRRARAGYIIELREKELVGAVEKIFSHQKKYQQLRHNAVNLARQFDITKILERLLKQI